MVAPGPPPVLRASPHNEISPGILATNDNTPLFQWDNENIPDDVNGVLDGLPDGWKADNWEIWIDNTPNFDNSGGWLIVENVTDNWIDLGSFGIELGNENYYWKVRGWLKWAVSDFSDVYSLIVDTVPPSTSSQGYVVPDRGKVDPDDNITTNYPDPLFKFENAVDYSNSPTGEKAGIRWYEVIVDDDLVPPYQYSENSDGSTDYDVVITGIAEGTWKWIVRAWDWAGNYTDSPTPYYITIDLTAYPPDLVSPENGSYLNYRNNIRLDWTDGYDPAGVRKYWVMSDNDNNFSSAALDEKFIATQSYIDFDAPADDKYFWHVKLKDWAGDDSGVGEGNWSDWSDTFWFIVDTLPPIVKPRLGPQNNENSRSAQITFSWIEAIDNTAYTTDVSGIDYYELWIDNDSDMKSPENVLTYPSTTATITLPDNIWYWAIVVYDKAGNKDNSQLATPWKLTVDNTPPPAPALSAPDNDAETNDNTPKFEWQEVFDVTGVTYEIWIDNTPTFDNSGGHLIIENTDNTWFIPSFELGDERYYWRVRAWDGKDWNASRENGPFSKTWALLIDTVPPDRPTSSPQYTEYYAGEPTAYYAGDGFLITENNKVRVHWNNVMDHSNSPTEEKAGLKYYELWIDNDPDFSSPEYIQFSVDNVFMTGDDNYPGIFPDENYSFRVRAWDDAGNASPWSPTWTFVVDTIPPTAPVLKSPENNAALNFLDVVHEWFESFDTGGVDHYVIEVSANPLFPEGSQILGTPKDVTGTSTTITYKDNGRFYWRVKAVDRAANESDWSKVWEVVIDLVPPLPPESLHTPENNHVTSGQTPTFTWKAAQDNLDNVGGDPTQAAGVENYLHQLDNDNDFSSPENFIVHIDNWFTLPDENALSVGDWYWRVWSIDRAGNMSEQPSDTFKVRINDLAISLEVDPNDNVVNPGEGVDIWGRASWQPDNLSVKNTQV
ncbi:MAG: hypothetical protein ACTSVD_05515, partial [Candidatus Thorarchaeota archaeon]